MKNTRWKFRIDDGAGVVVDHDGNPVASLQVRIGDYLIPAAFEATAAREDASDWPLITIYVEMQGSDPVIRELTLGSRPVIEVTLSGESPGSHRVRDPRDPGQKNPRQEDSQSRVRAVTGSLMREVPIAKLARYAMLGAAWRLDEESGSSERVVPDELRDDEGFYLIGPGETELQIGYEYAMALGDSAESSPYAWEWENLWTDYMHELEKETQKARPPERRNRITTDHLARVAEVYRGAIDDGRPPKKAVSTEFMVSQATAGRYIMQARKQGHLGTTLPGKKGEATPSEQS
jgi:hypothetical protein